MRRVLLGLVASCAFLLAATSVRKNQLQPRIVSQERFRPSQCFEDDPLGPCSGVRLLLENPIYSAAELRISCGDENDEQLVQIPPRSRLTVEVLMTLPVGGDSPCSMLGWKKL